MGLLYIGQTPTNNTEQEQVLLLSTRSSAKTCHPTATQYAAINGRVTTVFTIDYNETSSASHHVRLTTAQHQQLHTSVNETDTSLLDYVTHESVRLHAVSLLGIWYTVLK